MESKERFDSRVSKNKFSLKAFSEKRSRDFLTAEHYERYKFSTIYTRDKSVLDMACGSGYGSDYIARNGAKSVTGADKELSAVEEAKNRYKESGVNYMTMDAEQMDFPKESFDVAVSFETIEHIEYPEIFLARVRESVKKDGICIFSTPNRDVSNPGTTVTDHPKNPFHVREYVLEELLDLLGKYFTIQSVYGQGEYMKTTNVVCKKYMHIRQFISTFTKSGLQRITHVHSLTEESEPAYMVVVCVNNLK